ncbi:MAG: OmpA family protein [Candidatus Thioglobus sp.]|jgi:peptidoglycan-associated lipoprotein|nr:OmpA family protein [Candidatus Pseudothioglobus singularis]MDG1956764.1 OmpA family protein [Candidatus Thioglobus sp.]MDB4598882.1 OmpA family protein [Candidatus Pseudothioglobus singularis]MDB4847094.1 OmpA family protein [Candidatus Pseudothioglobus singularis]MDC0596360.1 OmpA family protein [Candidatus Pseudothioglobus singularis]MDC1065001.1 OmpA family protein [Candidatus Pseudothioglobus singularis]|tara:strand:- start:187 stop:1035 length:849 start_codon:yes stop_codon:yes gene_type:complete
MSKKILLLSSVIFLSSCATTNISELGDKFLDLINPSDDATEVAMLSGEETLIAMDEAGGFTIDELEELSNDELIAIAREKGLEDLILLDEDGNLLNRDQIINAIVESAALLESKSEELESMSDDELIEVAVAKGLTEQIVLDADGNLANREELVEALLESAAATEAAISEFGNNADSFTLYFAYDDTEIDEVATRTIIQHANFMQENPSVNLRLEGHADERGTREYNLALGENRALSVKEVLGLYNLDDRIIVVSYGEESPILTGSNEEAWEKNRRVEFSYY